MAQPLREARPRRRRRVIGLTLAVVLLWLIVGAVAAAQRHYQRDADASCAKVSTNAVTVAAGPLNYVGVDPTIDCGGP